MSACPICGAPTVAALRPFCSKRCADVDLHRWLSESYRVSDDSGAPANEDDGLPEAFSDPGEDF